MKKNYLFTLLICLGSITTSMGQTTQNGSVKEYKETLKKQPLGGVEMLITNAPSTVSDKKGNFALEFQTMRPGQKVNVRRIEKLGYEIFNKEALEQWNINPEEPFTIIMVRSDRFKKIRDNYSAVSSASYARQFEKEMKALEEERNAGKITEEQLRNEIIRLQEEYDRQLNNLDNYIDRFARIDLSELNKNEQEIIALVQAGKIEEAIHRYDRMNLVENYTRSIKNIQELRIAENSIKKRLSAEENSRDIIYSQVMRNIQLLTIQGGRANFDKIGQIYRDLISVDSTNLNILNEYTRYCIDQKKHKEAAATIHSYLSQATTLQQKAEGHNKLASLYLENTNYREAEIHFKEALSFLDKLQQTQPSYILDESRAAVYNNLGILYKDTRNYSEALSASLRSHELRAKLYAFDADTYYYSYSSIKYNIANLYVDIRHYDQAITRFQEALALIIDKSLHLDHAADIYSSIATCYQSMQDYGHAESNYLKAIDLLKQLYATNPERFYNVLALATENLATLYTAMYKYKEAEQLFLSAENLYEQHKEHSTGSVDMQHIYMYNNWGNLYIHIQQLEKAIVYMQKALQACEKLGANGATMANTIRMNIASIYLYTGRIDEAEALYTSVLQMNEKLFAVAPQVHCINLGQIQFNLGNLYSQFKNEQTTARLYFEQAIATFEYALKLSPNFINLVNNARNGLAYTYVFDQKYDQAISILDLCITTQPSEANFYDSKGEILLMMDKAQEAKQMWEKVMELDPQFLETHQSPLHKQLKEKGLIE